MKRRTFVSSVVALICLPVPFQCPYKIIAYPCAKERYCYTFYDDEKCVGYYRPDLGKFTVYINRHQLDVRIGPSYQFRRMDRIQSPEQVAWKIYEIQKGIQ